MNNHYAYINDNCFQIKIKDIYLFESKSINNGRIINKELFIKDYKKNINNKNILSTTIDILLNKEINEQDIYYYNNIFEELNYSKVNILSTSKYLDNNVMIINKDVYIIYNNKKYYYIYPFLFEDFLRIKKINILKIISDKYIKEVDKCKFYYYTNSNNYFIK